MNSSNKRKIMILSDPSYDAYIRYQAIKERINSIENYNWENLSIDLSHINPDTNIRRFNSYWIEEFKRRSDMADKILILGEEGKLSTILIEAVDILKHKDKMIYVKSGESIANFSLNL
ncbi:hypothetical protein [Spirochaeta cellobiosiphila]|uniref:hypothetical protein n=1 Tax=Spirochaeta cellobiosiphila TaxID=504483 RepID=UPI0003F6112E|nr:hypothetical protein [Spirochaeta cellobiosiphila]